MICQPHGFFNCSPAVDVPPSSLADLEMKENGMVVEKTSCHNHNALVSKM